MKAHAKVGNRAGRPTYRTPATFRVRRAMQQQRLPKNTNHLQAAV